MNFIEKIRAKSPQQKIRIIWALLIVAVIILAVAWIMIGNYQYSKDAGAISSIKSIWHNLNKQGK